MKRQIAFIPDTFSGCEQEALLNKILELIDLGEVTEVMHVFDLQFLKKLQDANVELKIMFGPKPSADPMEKLFQMIKEMPLAQPKTEVSVKLIASHYCIDRWQAMFHNIEHKQQEELPVILYFRAYATYPPSSLKCLWEGYLWNLIREPFRFLKYLVHA